MQFEGSREFALPPAELWARLRDARFLAQCVPDASVDPGSTRDEAQLNVTPGFSFAHGRLDITLRVIEAQEPTSLRVSILSKGVGSASQVDADVRLAPEGVGTRVQWSAAVSKLEGVLKMVPSGLVRGAAHKVIEDCWAGIAARLA